jgi:predicted outer membrane repeat protein
MECGRRPAPARALAGAERSHHRDTVNLQNLSVYDNSAEYGGAIFNAGTMKLDDVFVNRNTAEREGGGIYNSGTMTLEESTVLENKAMNGGGIYNKGSLTISARIESNEAWDNAGGLYNEGELYGTDSTINNNEAPHGLSGGVYNTGTRATIANSEIKGNRSRGVCKYLPDQDPVCDENPAGGGIYNSREGSLVLGGVNILGNRVDADDEREGRGGGVANFGHIIIAFSTIAGNQVDTSDYMEPWDDGRSYGGGFFNDGRAEIYNSTLSSNEALDNSFSHSYGGGIYNGASGDIYMENSTISSNFVEVGGGGGGGGIANLGFLEMSHVTVSHNKANDRVEGGPTSGIYNKGRGVLVSINSIVAMNPGKNCNNAADFQAYGQNLDSDESCPDFTIQGRDPLLGPLVNNGGPTETHRPDWQSHAVDKGDPDYCLRNDQRIYPRPYGDSCDLGAVELTEEDRR